MGSCYTRWALFALGAPLLVLVVGCPVTAEQPGNNNPNGGSTPTYPYTYERVAPFMPSAITLDINELPENPGVATEKSGLVSELQFGAAEVLVQTTASLAHRFQRLSDRALNLVAAIRNRMVDPTQTQVQGTLHVAGHAVAFKADFAPFDFDGDGQLDGSGDAVHEPVALRIWTDLGAGYRPLLCALIAQRPTAENAGRGQFYVHPSAAAPRAPADVQLFVTYDQTDASHKWNHAYITGHAHPLYDVTAGQARIDVRANGSGGVEKTVLGAADLAADPYQLDTLQSAAHYLAGGDALLVMARATRNGKEVSVDNECLKLAAPLRAGASSCDNFDTQDMGLLDIPAARMTGLPTSFIDQPTF